MSCTPGNHDGYVFEKSETSDSGVVWDIYRCACGNTIDRRNA